MSDDIIMDWYNFFPLGSCVPGGNHVLFGNEYHTIYCRDYPHFVVGTYFLREGSIYCHIWVPNIFAHILEKPFGIIIRLSSRRASEFGPKSMFWGICHRPGHFAYKEVCWGGVDLLEGCPQKYGKPVSVSSALQIS